MIGLKTYKIPQNGVRKYRNTTLHSPSKRERQLNSIPNKITISDAYQRESEDNIKSWQQRVCHFFCYKAHPQCRNRS
jgi:hypothetical protein